MLELRELAVRRERGPRAGAVAENSSLTPIHSHSDERYRQEVRALETDGLGHDPHGYHNDRCGGVSFPSSSGLVLVLLAGCGGGASKEEFQQAVVDARDRVDAGMAQVVQAGDFEELLNRLEIAADESSKAAKDLGEADAPNAVP